MAVGCVKIRWHPNAVPKPMQRRMKNMKNASPINSTVCVGRLLWILFCWIWHIPLTWHWESDHQWRSKLCRCENGVFRWGFCLLVRSCAEILYYHCDGNCAGSSISDQNCVKNREAAASRITLPRLYLQMNQRMNEHHSLLFCSLPACPILILSFQVFAFEKIFPQHDSACFSSQVSRYLNGSFQWSLSLETDIWKIHQTEL